MWASIAVGGLVGLFFGGYAASVLWARRSDLYPVLEDCLRRTVTPLVVGAGADGGISLALHYTNVLKLETSVVVLGYVGIVLALTLVPFVFIFKNATRWGRLSDRERRALQVRIIEGKDEPTSAARLGVSVKGLQSIVTWALRKLDPKSNWERLSSQEKRAIELRLIDGKNEKTCALALGLGIKGFRSVLSSALRKMDPGESS